MSIDMPIENASLTQLQQTPIDSVMNIIDEGLVHLPTYRELYYRWERQQWKAQDIDFASDTRPMASDVGRGATYAPLRTVGLFQGRGMRDQHACTLYHRYA